jgi:hypothetical protein
MVRSKILKLFVAGGIALPVVLEWFSVEKQWFVWGALVISFMGIVTLLLSTCNLWRQQGNTTLAKHAKRAFVVYIIMRGGMLSLYIASDLNLLSSMGSNLFEIVTFTFSWFPLVSACVWLWVAIIMFVSVWYPTPTTDI